MRPIKFRAFVTADFIGEEQGIMVYEDDKSDFLMVSNGNGFSLLDPNYIYHVKTVSNI